MPKFGIAQPKYTLLVANFSKPGMVDLGINPTKTRSGFEFRNLQSFGFAVEPGELHSNAAITNSTPGNYDPTENPVGTVDVINNDFSVPTRLLLGEYELISDEDYAANGLALGVIATNLATAISNLNGYNATPAGTIVNIEGPFGALGDSLILKAIYEGAVTNFTLSGDSLSYTVSPIVPPVILPP